MPWTLDNAEERAAEARRSFFIPPEDLRRSLKEGDEVKLIFRLQRETGETAVERMWVEVVATEPYIGELRNQPQLEGAIEFGDRVPFASEHVCAYAYPASELGYDPDTPCFLLKRVAQADDPPPVLLLNDDGQWEAHAEQESDEELSDSNNVLVWSLGYLTDRFPETEDALRDGSARRASCAGGSATGGGGGGAVATNVSSIDPLVSPARSSPRLKLPGVAMPDLQQLTPIEVGRRFVLPRQRQPRGIAAVVPVPRTQGVRPVQHNSRDPLRVVRSAASLPFRSEVRARGGRAAAGVSC